MASCSSVEERKWRSKTLWPSPWWRDTWSSDTNWEQVKGTLNCFCHQNLSLVRVLLVLAAFLNLFFFLPFPGQAVLHSPEKLSLGIWHKVVAERNKRAGYLKVNQGPVERRTSPGKAQGLNIHTPMYLGGVPNMDILPKPANVSAMFEGCIGEVRHLCMD